MTLYNDNDPFVCVWLRELIAAGHLPPGDVLHAPIETLTHEHISPYTTFHAFAGIGGWPLALRLAGWPDEQPVWTGSCPCQPFSCAGKRLGTGDERHLWPAFRALIEQHRPPIVFGEQVAARAGREWLAGVRADLEALGYAVGGADLCAAGVSAPMVSQRLHWVAASQRGFGTKECEVTRGSPEGSRAAGNNQRPMCNGDDPRMAPPYSYHGHWWSGPLQVGWNCLQGEVTRGGRKQSAQWRVKPGLSLLAHGVPNRVGQLCGFGNAIVPQLAATFVKAALEALGDLTR